MADNTRGLPPGYEETLSTRGTTTPSPKAQELIDRIQAREPIPDVASSPEPEQKPTPEVRTQTPEEREQELKDALTYAERVRTGEAQLPKEQDIAEFEDSVANIEAELETLNRVRSVEREYRQEGVEIPEEVKSQIARIKSSVYSEVAPFIDFRSGNIDIVSARRAGVTDTALRSVGATDRDIRKADVSIELGNYPSLPDLIRSGKVNLVREAQSLGLIASEDVVEAQSVSAGTFIREDALSRVSDFINSSTGTLNLVGAIQAKIRPETIRSAGFDLTNDRYNEVKRVVDDTVLLADGQRISKADFDSLDSRYQTIARTRGYDALVSAVDADVQSDIRNFEDAEAKLKRAGNSPTWALINNYATPGDIRLLYGDDADVFIKASEEWKKAEQTKRSVAILDVPARVGATLITAKLLAGGSAEYLGSKYLSPLSDYAKTLSQRTPDETILQSIGKNLVKVPVGVGMGSLMAVGGTAGLFSFVAGIPTNLDSPTYLNDFKKQMWEAVKDIGVQVAKDPVLGLSQVAGLILGPEGTIKLAKSIGAKSDPWYIPNQGTRFSFSTGKISTTYGEIAEAIKSGQINDVELARAIGRVINRALENPAATAKARVGRTNINITIEPTPASKWMGGGLWRSVPERTPYAVLERVVDVLGKEPAEFYSIQAAPRFALRSAGGTPATAPALILVYTKAGKLRAYPSSVQYATTLAEMERAGFKYLGSGEAKPGAYPPIKTYAGSFENESMLPNGMILKRVRNLRSRLLGERAGEFVTTVDGWVMPIYRFAEEGATIPKVGLSQLAAIRIASLRHGLSVLLGKRGFNVESGYAEVGALTRGLEEIGKAASVGLRGIVGEVAYRKAITSAMDAEVRKIYEEFDPKKLEQAWRLDPARFESSYINRLAQLQARLSGFRIEPNSLRPDTSYRTAQITYDRDGIARSAEDFIVQVGRVVVAERPGVRSLDGRPQYEVRRTDETVTGRIDIPRRGSTERESRISTPHYPPLRTSRTPETPRTPITPKTPVPVPALARLQTHSPTRTPVPDGSIAFAFGKRSGTRGVRVPQWYYIPPPYDQRKPISLPYPPIGAVETDSVSPYDTIQVIGRSRTVNVPKSVSIDLGITDARIEYGKRIQFFPRGKDTNVGTRVDSPYKGMSIVADGSEITAEEIESVDRMLGAVEDTRLNRKPSTKRPTRRSRENWLDRLTSVRGVKW